MSVLDEMRATVRRLAEVAAADGIEKMKRSASGGTPCTLYLYYKASTVEQDGELLLCPDQERPPTGYVLATGEGLRCNVPYENFTTWIHCRVGRLPILAWGG